MRRIAVKVVPNSRQEGVLEEEGLIAIRVSVPAREGKANDRARKLLARHLGIPAGALRLAAGHRSRMKIFEINP